MTRDPSGAAAGGGRVGTTVRIAALALLLCVVAVQRGAQAEEPAPVRRLPPVSELSPAELVPAVTVPVSYPDKGDESVVMFPEQGAQSEEPERSALLEEPSSASTQSMVRLISRDDPPVRIPDPNPGIYYTADANAEPAVSKDVSPFGDESKAADDDTDDTDVAGNQGEQNNDGEPQRYGRAPTNYSLQFLRDQDVLLNPGDWQFDTGFTYTLFDDDFPLPIFNGGTDVEDVVQARFRDRLVFTPLAFRYGWSKNVQLFATLPAGYSGSQLSTIGESVSSDRGGIGDLTAGASFHLLSGGELLPDVVSTLSTTAPTGVFNAPVGSIIPGTALGQGFWAFSAQLLFINRYDPIIAFYGVGYRHLFERPFDGVLFQPGEQLNYQFGVGFAANDRVTLSATFLGFYISQTLLDRTALAGTNVEPMSLRFAATIARNDRIVEPFAQIGMTDFAPAASLGVTITFY